MIKAIAKDNESKASSPASTTQDRFNSKKKEQEEDELETSEVIPNQALLGIVKVVPPPHR